MPDTNNRQNPVRHNPGRRRGASFLRIAAPLALAVPMLAACATPNEPIEVTRFHAADVDFAMQQTVSVVPAPGEADTLEMAPFLAAVGQELNRLGYGPAAEGKYIAEVTMRRDIWQPGRDRNPVSVGVGGSTGSYGSGVGLGVGIDLSGPPPEQAATRLSVTIRDRATGDSIWEGRAVQQIDRKSELAQPTASARLLAEALFVDFPGESGESYSVKQD